MGVIIKELGSRVSLMVMEGTYGLMEGNIWDIGGISYYHIIILSYYYYLILYIDKGRCRE
jgi:hypothetical protein